MGAWVDHYSDNGRGIFKASKWLKSHKLNDYLFIKKIKHLRKIIYFFLEKFYFKIFYKIFNKFLFFSKTKKKTKFLDFYYPQEIFSL